MKHPFRISVVSYLNSVPFVYGIRNSGLLRDSSLSLDIPSVCGEKILKGKADIGLAPVAILLKIKKPYILPDFCIGANGAVRSVMLYSDVPLSEIETIFLDYQSKTSVLLVQILARYFWMIHPRFEKAVRGYEKKIGKRKAGVIIGDRNFNLKKKYRYVYDLAAEWKQYTGLPFVFACWIGKKNPGTKMTKALRAALEYGLDHKKEAVRNIKSPLSDKKKLEYLENNINFHLDGAKEQALSLFLKLGRKMGS